MTKTIKSLLLLLCLLCVGTALGAPGVKLQVEMPRGRRSIAVGDVFYIQIQVTDMDAEIQAPQNFPGAKLNYFARTGRSSSFTSINGQTTQSSSTIYTATLRAEKEGTFSFGPIKVGGRESNKVSYAIGAPGSNVQQPQQPRQQQSQSSQMPGRIDPDAGPTFIGKGDGNLFLRANVSKTTAYEQEALVYTVKLYSTYSGIRFIGATTAPKFDGFVVEESEATDTQLRYEEYQGKQYATAVIARYIIFPQMSGQLKVLGNTYTVSVNEREYYHDPFWGTMGVNRPLQLNVTPNDLVINVKDLPQPQPSDFSGGVGKFHLSSSLKDNVFRTNQAASIVYTITGTGNLKYVRMPDLNTLYPNEIEVYTPTSEVKADVGSTSVSGFVKYDYSFMPLETGTFKIPQVTLVYFNPATGEYERSVADGYTINVEQGKSSGKSQTKDNLKADTRLLSVAELSFSHTPMVKRFLYWLWIIIPALALAAALIGSSAYRRRNADAEAVRSRKANRMAHRRLKKAQLAMRRNDRNTFIDELLNAIWGYLGDKLKMPPSELSRQNVSAILQERSVPQEQIDALIQLLDLAEFAKYAPSAPGSDMQSLYNQTVEAISNMEAAFKQNKTVSTQPDTDRIAFNMPTAKEIRNHSNDSQQNEK